MMARGRNAEKASPSVLSSRTNHGDEPHLISVMRHAIVTVTVTEPSRANHAPTIPNHTIPKF